MNPVRNFKKRLPSFKNFKTFSNGRKISNGMKGFTLIELIIYAGIVTVILVVASNFAWQIIQGNIKFGALMEVEENANFAMEKIVTAIKNASNIAEPANPGEETDYLYLEMQDLAKSLTKFEISNDKLVMSEGNSGPFPLTSDLVKVTKLKFTNLSYQETPGTVRIEMTIQYLNPTGRPEYGAEVNLENTFNIRF